MCYCSEHYYSKNIPMVLVDNCCIHFDGDHDRIDFLICIRKKKISNEKSIFISMNTNSCNRAVFDHCDSIVVDRPVDVVLEVMIATVVDN